MTSSTVDTSVKHIAQTFPSLQNVELSAAR
jgi:hypothetical protein